VPTHTLWTPAMIREKILASDKMLERSISKIYAQQTTSEQNIGATVEHNKIGFTAFDAEFLSSLAQQLERHAHLGTREGQRLSSAQIPVARRKMVKYAKQLSKLVAEEHNLARQCSDCNGTGNALDEQHTCHRCHGTGWQLPTTD